MGRQETCEIPHAPMGAAYAGQGTPADQVFQA
jgi:hypothetical protein